MYEKIKILFRDTRQCLACPVFSLFEREPRSDQSFTFSVEAPRLRSPGPPAAPPLCGAGRDRRLSNTLTKQGKINWCFIHENYP